MGKILQRLKHHQQKLPSLPLQPLPRSETKVTPFQLGNFQSVKQSLKVEKIVLKLMQHIEFSF